MATGVAVRHRQGETGARPGAMVAGGEAGPQGPPQARRALGRRSGSSGARPRRGSRGRGRGREREGRGGTARRGGGEGPRPSGGGARGGVYAGRRNRRRGAVVALGRETRGERGSMGGEELTGGMRRVSVVRSGAVGGDRRGGGRGGARRRCGSGEVGWESGTAPRRRGGVGRPARPVGEERRR